MCAAAVGGEQDLVGLGKLAEVVEGWGWGWG